MKSIAISRPNSSPARRVNLLIMEHAPTTASKKSNAAVQTHTLKIKRVEKFFFKLTAISFQQITHHQGNQEVPSSPRKE